MWKKTWAPLPPFGPHKNLLNSNLASKLVSTAAAWIVLSFDIPYYSELPPYSPKTEIENWVNKCHRRGCSFEQSSVKRNIGASVWMVLHDLHDISAFVYYGSKKVVLVERECSKPAEKQQTLITNRLQETLVLAQNTQNNEKIKIFWKTSLLTFLLFNVFLASSCIFVQRRKYLWGRYF